MPPRALHGRIAWRGLRISIENRKGSWRHWFDPHANRSGSTFMHHPYGYLRGTEGDDGEHLDCYIGPDLHGAKHVHIVRQMKAPDFKRYDEAKAMIGFRSAADAKAAYLRQYDDPRFFGKLQSVHVDKFVHAVKNAANGKVIIKAAGHKYIARKRGPHAHWEYVYRAPVDRTRKPDDSPADGASGARDDARQQAERQADFDDGALSAATLHALAVSLVRKAVAMLHDASAFAPWQDATHGKGKALADLLGVPEAAESVRGAFALSVMDLAVETDWNKLHYGALGRGAAVHDAHLPQWLAVAIVQDHMTPDTGARLVSVEGARAAELLQHRHATIPFAVGLRVHDRLAAVAVGVHVRGRGLAEFREVSGDPMARQVLLERLAEQVGQTAAPRCIRLLLPEGRYDSAVQNAGFARATQQAADGWAVWEVKAA
uniref:Inorganic pyrophosphatase domain-containing protein n=1 Tax=uncultured Caudovirales phage TaxID=2100421 RepID=A0A6J5L2F8_9CAUD|nr:hypothetical protein UFOVP114_68 [uncultured Caudovirales phage]